MAEPYFSDKTSREDKVRIYLLRRIKCSIIQLNKRFHIVSVNQNNQF